MLWCAGGAVVVLLPEGGLHGQRLWTLIAVGPVFEGVMSGMVCERLVLRRCCVFVGLESMTKHKHIRAGRLDGLQIYSVIQVSMLIPSLLRDPLLMRGRPRGLANLGIL